MDDGRRMTVEIWSDVMCPFCYIGKRRFEKALAELPRKDRVDVIWKSFQLDPGIRAAKGRSVNEYLAERKGWSPEEARAANARVTRMAEGEGLRYDFDKAVVANSFDAHRLVQLGKSKGVGDAVEENLFRAYFTEGRDISDPATLAELGTRSGLEAGEVRAMLADGGFRQDVERDLLEARQIGVMGVPFFVLDRRYALSGAQESGTFLRILQRTWDEKGPADAAGDAPADT
jgi:predicted DsbA family dithiol-disulfide isomerase